MPNPVYDDVMKSRQWTPAATLGVVMIAAAALLTSCSGAPEVDLTKLRVFFSSDAIGYLEPCG